MLLKICSNARVAPRIPVVATEWYSHSLNPEPVQKCKTRKKKSEQRKVAIDIEHKYQKENKDTKPSCAKLHVHEE
jgi:hypothetical protein